MAVLRQRADAHVGGDVVSHSAPYTEAEVAIAGSVDWTPVRSFHTLMAAALPKGRAVPLLWASDTAGQPTRSQNSFQWNLLRLLVTMLLSGVRVILLADRGLGRTELPKTYRDLCLRHVIRIKPDVRVTHPSDTERLDDYPIKKGMWRVLRNAA